MNGVTNPFPTGTANSKYFRIPAILTLKSGRIAAFADVRYGNGTDNPANIETAVRYSDDNGKNWSDCKFVNNFDDMENADFKKAVPSSASFIDSAVVETNDGVIYHVCDACPAYTGLWYIGKYGTDNGYIDGKLALCDKTTDSKTECKTLNKRTYAHYVGEFSQDGYAPVLNFENDDNYNDFFVDRNYNIYTKANNKFEPFMITQLKSDGSLSDKKTVANIFYALSPLKIYPTYYLWLKKSYDGGETWSTPEILNPKVNSKGFTGFAPGRGICINTGESERVMFAVYDNNDGTEYASVVYTDDGNTWHRSAKADKVTGCGKSSETQFVLLNNDTVRMYSRNTANYIGYCDSHDGGKTWGEYKLDKALKYCSNCQFSVINYSQKIDGKNALIISYPSEKTRKRGILKTGLYGNDNIIEWKYSTNITKSLVPFSFVYSCLTELNDSSVLDLYECDKAAFSIRHYNIKDLKKTDCENLTFPEKIKSRILNALKK